MLKESALLEDMESGQSMEVSPIYMSRCIASASARTSTRSTSPRCAPAPTTASSNITEPLDTVLRSYLLFRQRRG